MGAASDRRCGGLLLAAPLGGLEQGHGTAPGPFAVGDPTGDGFELGEFGSEDFHHVAGGAIALLGILGPREAQPGLSDLVTSIRSYASAGLGIRVSSSASRARSLPDVSDWAVFAAEGGGVRMRRFFVFMRIRG
jgi:hypothetical protein